MKKLALAFFIVNILTLNADISPSGFIYGRDLYTYKLDKDILAKLPKWKFQDTIEKLPKSFSEIINICQKDKPFQSNDINWTITKATLLKLTERHWLWKIEWDYLSTYGSGAVIYISYYDLNGNVIKPSIEKNGLERLSKEKEAKYRQQKGIRKGVDQDVKQKEE